MCFRNGAFEMKGEVCWAREGKGRENIGWGKFSFINEWIGTWLFSWR